MKLTDREQNGVVVLEPKGKIMGDIVVPASDEKDDIYESIKRDNQLMISSMVLPSFRLTRPSSEILK